MTKQNNGITRFDRVNKLPTDCTIHKLETIMIRNKE